MSKRCLVAILTIVTLLVSGPLAGDALGAEKKMVPEFPATRQGQGFIYPEAGELFVARDEITVIVESGLTDVVNLSVNGSLVSKSKIGTRKYGRKTERARYVYVSVPLERGTNRLVLTGKSPEGGEFRRVRRVTLSGSPASIRLSYDEEKAVADGRTELPVRVRVLDQAGNRALTGAFATVRLQGGELATEDQNPYRDGKQISLARGRGTIRLEPLEEPRNVNIEVESGRLVGRKTVSYAPAHRDWLWAGIGEVNLNYPLYTEGDWKDEMVWSGIGSGPEKEVGPFLLGSSGSLWGQGYTDNLGLVTLAYDSEAPLLGPSNRSIYPENWNDSASLGRTVDSSWNFYARADLDNGSRFLVGDFDVNYSDPLLYSYQRRFTGVSLDFRRGEDTYFKFFGTNTAQSWGRDEFKGGTCCSYELSDAPVKVDSEEVWLEVRNESGVVLKEKPQERGEDYWIDYQSGEVVFTEPVPEENDKGNPIYVVVQYEVMGRALKEEDVEITGCTIGPYDLSADGILPGSERVTLKAVDPGTGDLVKEEVLKTPGDYTMNYSDGEFTLNSPVCPTDGDGNEQSFKVVYRTHESTKKYPVVGAKVGGDGENFSWDLSFLNQSTVGSLPQVKIFDAGFSYELAESSLQARWAENSIPLGGDDVAFGLGYDWTGTGGADLDFSLSYRLKGPSFVSPSASSPFDYEKSGGNNSLKATLSGEFGEDLLHEESLKLDFAEKSAPLDLSVTAPFWKGHATFALEEDLWEDDEKFKVFTAYEQTIRGVKSEVFQKYSPDGWRRLGYAFELGRVTGEISQEKDPEKELQERDISFDFDLPGGFTAGVDQVRKVKSGEASSSFEWGLSKKIDRTERGELSLSASGGWSSGGDDDLTLNVKGSANYPTDRDEVSLIGTLVNDSPPIKSLRADVKRVSPEDWDLTGRVCVGPDKLEGRLDYVHRPLPSPVTTFIGQLRVNATQNDLSLTGSAEEIYFPNKRLELSGRGVVKYYSHGHANSSVSYSSSVTNLGRLRTLWRFEGTSHSAGGHFGFAYQYESNQLEGFAGLDWRIDLRRDLAVVLGFNFAGLRDQTYPGSDYSYFGPFIQIETTVGGSSIWD
mgnify:FL=1